jgi:hypothetical protein
MQAHFVFSGDCYGEERWDNNGGAGRQSFMYMSRLLPYSCKHNTLALEASWARLEL